MIKHLQHSKTFYLFKRLNLDIFLKLFVYSKNRERDVCVFIIDV